jgi:hypothetical protein
VNIPALHEDCTPDPSDPANKCAICATADQTACIPQKGALPRAYSGKWAYWFGNPNTFNFLSDTNVDCAESNGGGGNTVEGTLTSPWFSLGGVEMPFLSFYSAWEIESVDPQAPPNGYDQMMIEVQAGESDWQQIGYLNPDLDANGESAQCYSSAGLDAAPVWVNYAFDLSDYSGTVVRIRFHFNSADGAYNGFRGWLVDRVRVLGWGCGVVPM